MVRKQRRRAGPELTTSAYERTNTAVIISPSTPSTPYPLFYSILKVPSCQRYMSCISVSVFSPDFESQATDWRVILASDPSILPHVRIDRGAIKFLLAVRVTYRFHQLVP
jgi:hypothetical protein